MKKWTSRGATAVALIASAAVALTGCVSSPTNTDSPPASEQFGRTVNTEFTQAPSGFDPAVGTAGEDLVARSLLYATLVNKDNDGSSKFVGSLATRWEVESPSTYVFTIRTDATCADGTVITPTVIANSLTYLADNTPDAPHISAPLVFGSGTPTISADDANSTVTIQTAEAYPHLLDGLAVPYSSIICPAGLSDLDGLNAGTVKGAFSGPYTLAEAKTGISYTFEARTDYTTWPDYTEPLDGLVPERMVFTIRTDVATSANKLLSGDLDVSQLANESLNRFNDSDWNKAVSVVANVYVMFNERPGHYFADNPQARKAVAQAIDRVAFNQVFSNGVSPLFNSVVPPTYACVLEDTSLIEGYDSAAAKKTLAGAKFEMVASNVFGDQGNGAEYIRQVLADAGATVDFQLLDNATWADQIQSPPGTWDVTLMGDINRLGVISASLIRVMGPTLEEGGRNIPANDNPEGAAAVKAALATTDPVEQCKQYEIAQKTMLERYDVVPLAGIVWTTISPKDVVVHITGGVINKSTIRIVK